MLNFARARLLATAKATKAILRSMTLTTKGSVSTEKKIEDGGEHNEQGPEQLWVDFRAQMEQLRLDAGQQEELKTFAPTAVAININDLPAEVIRQVLQELKPPHVGQNQDHASFYNALKVCRRWRTIGMELVFNRSTQGWSSERWNMMSKILKHTAARLMKIQAQYEAQLAEGREEGRREAERLRGLAQHNTITNGTFAKTNNK